MPFETVHPAIKSMKSFLELPKTKIQYILEVNEYYLDFNEYYQEVHPKSKHIGYMNKIFDSKEEAIEYYDKFNPHMPSINKHNNGYSQHDPKTNLMYTIKKYCNEKLDIQSFET
jgi:hypothetical protein